MAGIALEIWARKLAWLKIGDEVNEDADGVDVKLKWNRSRIAWWGEKVELEVGMVTFEPVRYNNTRLTI